MIRRAYILAAAMLLWSAPAQAQPVVVGARSTFDAGYLTSATIDPALSAWAPAPRAPMVAWQPSLWLRWQPSRLVVGAWGQGRLVAFPGTSTRWSEGQTGVWGQRALGRWSARADAGFASSSLFESQRLAWAGAGIEYARRRTTFGARAGVLRRAAAGTAERNVFGELKATLEGAKGWRLSARAYRNAVLDDIGPRATGTMLALERMLPSGAAVGVRAGADRYASTDVPDGAQWVGRVTVSARWPLSRRWSLGARSKAERGPGRRDAGASMGVSYARLWTPGTDAVRPFWSRVGAHVRFEVPYQGHGRLVLVGDFNDWDAEGVVLEERSEGVWTATLRLAPGTYQYRIRVDEEGQQRWLPFPASEPTIDDSFGGRNGLLMVE